VLWIRRGFSYHLLAVVITGLPVYCLTSLNLLADQTNHLPGGKQPSSTSSSKPQLRGGVSTTADAANPNCPAPVVNGVKAKRWSCRTSTQTSQGESKDPRSPLQGLATAVTRVPSLFRRNHSPKPPGQPSRNSPMEASPARPNVPVVHSIFDLPAEAANRKSPLKGQLTPKTDTSGPAPDSSGKFHVGADKSTSESQTSTSNGYPAPHLVGVGSSQQTCVNTLETGIKTGRLPVTGEFTRVTGRGHELIVEVNWTRWERSVLTLAFNKVGTQRFGGMHKVAVTFNVSKSTGLHILSPINHISRTSYEHEILSGLQTLFKSGVIGWPQYSHRNYVTLTVTFSNNPQLPSGEVYEAELKNETYSKNCSANRATTARR
jgi:hypothetical protein